MTAQQRRGGRPLDPERPATEPASPSDRPGLWAQFAATRQAATGFVRAHIALARTEIDAIKGEVGRAAALGGIALASGILLTLLLSIGGMLFAGEWIFGSIGWGLLLGSELLVAVAVTAVLVALRIPGLATDIVVALILGVIAGLVLGFDLPNALFRSVGDASGLGVDAAVRPLVLGVIIVGLLGAVVGLLAGARGGGGSGAIGGLIAGLIAGVLAGAFLSITFGLRVGAALGVATFLLAWPVLNGIRTQRQGIDTEALKRRFYPSTTIDTTKESIEWAKARVPRTPRS
jgi:hypothetical protein